MKYIELENLKAGMVVAKNIFGRQSELLLSVDCVLTTRLINRMVLSECEGAYIADGSEDEPQENGIISSKLKENTVKAVKDFFIGAEQNNSSIKASSFSAMKQQLNNIIDELSCNKNAMVNMADLKVFDDYTYYHCVSVTGLSIMVGIASNMCRSDLYKLGMGALLHDIGKMFIPKKILNKNGPLNKDEYDYIKRHCQLGFDYLKMQNQLSAEPIIAVLTHHERYDSKGYPLGLPQNKQTIEGKIIAVCDNYDALISDRPYRKAFSPSEAIEYIMGNSGTMFDPKILDIFLKKIELYPVGTVVKLSNGKTGRVIETYRDCCMRPKIMLIPSNNDPDRYVIYDLRNNPELLNVTVIGINRPKGN